MRTRLIRPRLVVALFVVMAVLLAGESVALATSYIRAGGAVKAMKVATSDEPASVNSNEWQPVPSMAFSMAVPSGQKGLFLATFSTESRVEDASTNYCELRVLIDGIAVAPGPVDWDMTGHIPFQPKSMQFLAGPMPAGQHSFSVQFRVSIGTGYEGCVFRDRTLSVLRSTV